MASRIAGITIEIGGNTTKLQKSLDGVNKKLRSTSTALKDVNKLLKLNPGNTDLLRQKQQYLTTAIDETKKKLQQEKAALEQLKAANTTGEITEDQKALEREIIATEGELKKLQKEYKDFGSVGAQQLQAVGGKLKDLGGKIKDCGMTLTKHLTGPIVAMGTAAMAAFAEVDKGMDIITKKTGASGSALAEMQESAKTIATTIPVSFESAGSAIGEVNTRFGLTGENLENLATQFLKFAYLNDTDVSQSIDNVQKALSAFGLGSEDAVALLDALNKTSQTTGASTDSLVSGLVQNATAFQELGLSAEQSAVFMGQMEKSGANSETVMQGLRKALKNATKDGKPLNQALRELQDTIKNGTGSVDGLTAAYDIFGKSGDQIYGAVKNGTLDFEALGDAALNSGGSVTKTFQNTLDPLSQFKTSMNEVKLLATDIAVDIGPILVEVMGKLRDVVKDLREKWNNLSDDQKDHIIKFVTLAAVIGPVITLIGFIVGGIGSLISAGGAIVGFITATLIPAIGGIIAAVAPLVVAAAPFLIGGAIIAGIVAGVIYIVKHWEEIKAAAAELKEKVVEKWENLKQSTSEKWEEIKQTTQEKWQGIKQDVQTKAAGIKEDVLGKWEEIKKNAKEKWENIKQSIVGPIEAAQERIRNAIEKIKGFFDVKLEFPHINLPHFNIFGGVPPWGLGGKGQKPSISIDWYKKAYSNPVLFRQPTVLQTSAGLKGFGDGAGAEIVMGLDKLRQLVGANQQQPSVQIGKVDIVIEGAGKSADQIARELQNILNRKAVAYA